MKNIYMSLNISLLTFAGLYSHEIKSDFRLKLYFIYKAVNLIVITLSCIWMAFGIVNAKSFALVEDAVAVLQFTLQLTTCYLIAYFGLKKDHLRQMFAFMEDDFLYFSETGVYQVTMSDYIKGAKRVTVFWSVYVASAIVTQSVALSIIQGQLPLHVWCFYDCYASPAYEVTTVFTLYAQYVFLIVFISTDVLFPSFAYVGVGQMKILACNYKNAFYATLLKLGVPKEEVELYSTSLYIAKEQQEHVYTKINRLMESNKFEAILINIFTQNVARHQKLLTYIKDVDGFFSNYFAVKMIMYAGYAIASLYLVIARIGSMSQAVSYLVGIIIPTFFLNYFGQLFADEYNEISLSLYQSPWYMGSRKFQKMFLFAQMAVNKPITLTAGKMMDITIDTFKGFMKLCVSFSTLIRQLSNRD